MRSRRDFLKHASLTTAGLLVACGPPGAVAPTAGADDGELAARGDTGHGFISTQPAPVPPELTDESALFPIGVASGDAHDDVVTLWTRYDGTRSLSLSVWQMEGERYGREHVRLDVHPSEGVTHIQVAGLVTRARYRFAFFEMEDGARVGRSLVGRFRGPIGIHEAPPVVLGATSCTNLSKGFHTLQRAAEMADLDAFLFLGDTAYCDGSSSLADYRLAWQQHLGREEHRALRASTTVYATWDDHEVANDWSPERIDPVQLQHARRAFFEQLPLERDVAEPDRIWRSRRLGRSVEIFVLDSRGERRPSSILSNDEQYLSRTQMDWLKEGLAASPCAFKVIMNSVPITRFPNVWSAWQVDRWDAYDSQRTEILSFIDDNALTGVLWVSGDFHLAKMGRVSPSGPGATQVEVLVGPGAQDPNPLLATVVGDHFDWVSGENNVTRLELDPASLTARLVAVNGAGEVIQDRAYNLG